MYYHFDRFRSLGMANSDVFLIEKAVAFDIRVKDYEQEERDHAEKEKDHEEYHKCNNGGDNGNLEILKMPPLTRDEVVDEVEEENDGFRTPTSMEHKTKIPVPLQCPPAPRKPKSAPCSRKRKASFVASDLSREIEMLFPQPRLVKIKKAKGYTE